MSIEAEHAEPVDDPVVDDDQPAEDPRVESKAREMGWVPEGEFKGDPAKWRQADEFVQRGEEVIGFIKKDRDKAKARVDELEGKMAKAQVEYGETFKRLEHMNTVALDQQRRQLSAQYGAEKRRAVEVGDSEAYDRLEAQEKEAVAELDKQATAPVPEPENQATAQAQLTPAQQTTVQEWVADNNWFSVDSEMNAVASSRHEKLMSDKPGLSLAENLAEVRDYVKGKYPEKFGIEPDAPRGSNVEGGTRSSGGSGGSNGSMWTKLPKEAKEQANRMIKDGQFSRGEDGIVIEDMAKRRQRYAEIYFQGDEA